RRAFVAWQQKDLAKYFHRGIISMCHHVMFFCVDLFQHINEDPSIAQASSVGLFGRVVDDEELFEMAKERFANSPVMTNSYKESARRLYRILYGTKRYLNQTIESYVGYQVTEDTYGASREYFNRLLYSCTDLTPALGAHMVCSESSSLLNLIIFIVLQKATGEINANVYSDFARLLTTSSEVESADVPAAMERLAFYIYKDMKPEEFKSMKTEEALQWLETSSTTAGKKYREFLVKHGHRCLREFDIRSLTWRTDPKTLVKLLQNLVGSVKSDRPEKKQESFKEIISEVKAPLSFKTRLLLRIILPLSRKAVQNRECSKSK
ncbi:phosphoenolpyruvate synthase, partial [Caerostris extrusa]